MSASFSDFRLGRDLHDFLAHRCSKEFLLLYLEHAPEILDQICEPGPLP